MGKSGFQTRRNVMTITSIQSFSGIKGGYRSGCRDVYFVRCIGCGRDTPAELREMDRLWKEGQAQGRGRYLRVGEMPKLKTPQEAERYAALYEGWRKAPEDGVPLKGAEGNAVLSHALSEGLLELCALFQKYMAGASETMERNFLIKILFWTERLAEPFLSGWDEKTCRKFVCSGTVKLQEYLFCYFLTLIGVDVLILLPAGDSGLAEELKGLSAAVVLGETGTMEIPPYVPERTESGALQPVRREQTQVNQTTPERAVVTYQASAPRQERAARRELDFEELAKLASSVVMIAVHDSEGEAVCTGSGIMIGKDGYILTNFHVAGRGASYSVRIENDETIYETDELIKYNQSQDLAILRIDRKLKPIPLYRGEKPLARGQKVVAIGSPLGLFNSVSDGIISGFRTIGEIDMIQFTAPISSGSSGGAVLNMQGEIIGISTAGFDGGQNINLAVDYRTVAAFVRGFT